MSLSSVTSYTFLLIGSLLKFVKSFSYLISWKVNFAQKETLPSETIFSKLESKIEQLLLRITYYFWNHLLIVCENIKFKSYHLIGLISNDVFDYVVQLVITPLSFIYWLVETASTFSCFWSYHNSDAGKKLV